MAPSRRRVSTATGTSPESQFHLALTGMRALRAIEKRDADDLVDVIDDALDRDGCFGLLDQLRRRRLPLPSVGTLNRQSVDIHTARVDGQRHARRGRHRQHRAL